MDVSVKSSTLHAAFGLGAGQDGVVAGFELQLVTGVDDAVAPTGAVGFDRADTATSIPACAFLKMSLKPLRSNKWGQKRMALT